MQLLEFFYEQPWHKGNFFPRKQTFTPAPRVALHGPKECGKSSLLKMVAKEHFNPKEVLFIDCKDLRCDQVGLEHLEAFIHKHAIRLLCVADYDATFTLPECEQIWLTTAHPLEGFTNSALRNLDFEEFLAFDKRHDPKVAFNNFLKSGNFPQTVRLDEWHKERRSQEILRITFGEDLPIFKEIAFFQGHTTSAYFIFTRAKERFKISKDRFYFLFEAWQHLGYIHALPKWNAKRAAPKIFFYNFLTKPLLYPDREFPKIFENMVFLELQEQCFYVEPLGLYLPHSRRLVLAIPFGDEVCIQRRIEQVLAKNTLELESIEVVTVASSFRYETKGIPCEIVPFYEWALGE